MRSLVALVALVALSIAACDEGPATGDLPSLACAFTDEIAIAETSGGFDAVAIAARGHRALVAWTAPDGTFARPIDGAGAATDEPIRVAPACTAGLALASRPGGAWLACGTLPMREADKPGALVLFSLALDGRVEGRHAIAALGGGSRGVSVATDGRGALVAWNDGEARSVSAARFVRGEPIEPRRISRDGTLPGPPFALVVDGHALVTWAESATTAAGVTVGEILVDDGRGAPHRIASVLADDAQPRLANVRGPLLTYRDENPAGSRVALYLQPLTTDLARRGESVRVGRSDAPSGASVFPCGTGVYTVAAHGYGTHEALVGVRNYDLDLAPRTGERQIYVAEARYEHGVGACLDGGAVIVVAERAPSPNVPAELKTTTLDCQ